MKELSNNVLVILISVFVIITLLEFAAYQIKYGEITLKATAVGFVGMCIDNNPLIIPIASQTAYIGTPFAYDVNTTVANDLNVTFYDDTPLFTINYQTGMIAFTPQEGDENDYYINISVISSCGRLSDVKSMRLSVKFENRAPILDPIPDQAMNQNDLFTYDVNATDADNDTLFFGDNTTMFQINSNNGLIYFVPQQADVGNQSVLIWVMDGRGGIDWQIVNFEITDVNDAPVLATIGAQTAIINETYVYDVNATDADVKPEWNNLSFYDDAAFFNINPSTGLIQFFVNGSYNGTYSLNITVSDGYLSDEETISFSVIAVNHAPNITSWYPENATLEISEGESSYFNITKFDLDGTIPSTAWYLDGVVLAGQTADEYTYYAGYTSSGTHNLTVVITDGELDDAQAWTINVRDVPQIISGAAGPSQIMPPACTENWRCTEWAVCPVYEIQTRSCRDLSSCGTISFKPDERRKCFYTPQPSCSDDVINCHDGGCEIWIDCGGPCPPCATCSDKLKNCHMMSKLNTLCEEGVDCGGPCPTCPEGPQPAVCGNAICEQGELLSCTQDCGLFFGQFIIVVIAFGGASIFLYRFSALAVLFYRKKIRPLPYTNIELLGAAALRQLHLIQLEMGRKTTRAIVSELSSVIRDFFAKAFEVRRKFTYIELAEVARKRKLDKPLVKRITDFSIKMTELEYKYAEPSLAELAAAIKAAIAIVERLSGVRLHEALGKKAEEEIHAKEPQEKPVQLPQGPQAKGEGEYKMTQSDEESVRRLQVLIDEGEKAITSHATAEAEKAYARIRETYDRLRPEVKMKLYAETIRIIKLYNEIMKSE